jgi:ABC-2 type transport system permease protein
MKSFLRLLALEYRLFAGSRTVVTLVLGGVILYALLYNFMYLPQVVRGVPVAVVDEDHTAQSRLFVRRLSASPQLSVVRRCAQREEAQQALRRGEVQGVVCLPRQFARRLQRGPQDALYVMQGSTASLLTYAALQESVTAVAASMRSSSAGGRAGGGLTVVTLPVYNPTGGYGTYLIPAVLMVILFQTLLMASAVRAGTDYQSRYRPYFAVVRRRVPTWKGAARWVLSRGLVWAGVYGVMAFFVVGLVPWLFDLPHAGSPLTLAVLMAAYLAATIAFALACAPLFRDAEGGLVYIAFFSVGYLFLSGVSYPLELMPAAWRFVRMLFPVCPATLAYVEAQTMGAPISDISSQILWLFLQAKIYLSVAVIGHYRLLRSASDYEFLKNTA